MAKPTTARWSKLLIQVEDPASPGTFVAPCGLTTKGLNRPAQTSDTNVPDCDDPDLPSWTERVVRALSASVSGSGVLALESLDIWDGWFAVGDTRNVKVTLDVPLASNGRSWLIPMVLTTFNLTGNESDGKMQVSIELQNDGAIVTTPAAA